MRLRDYGNKVGLKSEEKYNEFNKKKQDIEDFFELLNQTSITPKKETNEYVESIGTTPLKDGISLYEFLKRPEVKLEHLEHFIEIPYSDEVKEQVDINNLFSNLMN